MEFFWETEIQDVFGGDNIRGNAIIGVFVKIEKKIKV